jgi:hypothetical protein
MKRKHNDVALEEETFNKFDAEYKRDTKEEIAQRV